jgi:hypothetical protein
LSHGFSFGLSVVLPELKDSRKRFSDPSDYFVERGDDVFFASLDVVKTFDSQSSFHFGPEYKDNIYDIHLQMKLCLFLN